MKKSAKYERRRLHTDAKEQEATSPLEFKVRSCLGASWSLRAIEEGGGVDGFFLSIAAALKRMVEMGDPFK
eukprot:4218969-Karenia_brevis.AAC.1